ncbi:MAG: 2Fe-2S iron-sulfur cluster binding domain-containing protein, partial [Pseudomonadales bacterium]|nr:2Fe-2S iron-sulfur cluster binding domain-containing protein [Pseudomonadales bacterium]
IFKQAGIDDERVHVELYSGIPSVEDNTELKPRVVSFYKRGALGGVKHIRQRQVETLLETANRNNIKIASSCTMGTCKSCKVKVKRGSVVMDEPNMLSMQEAEDGYVLACVAYPCESVMVKLPPR